MSILETLQLRPVVSLDFSIDRDNLAKQFRAGAGKLEDGMKIGAYRLCVGPAKIDGSPDVNATYYEVLTGDRAVRREYISSGEGDKLSELTDWICSEAASLALFTAAQKMKASLESGYPDFVVNIEGLHAPVSERS